MPTKTHDCEFPEVVIGEDDGPLLAGMKVLAPCSCGETPTDYLGVMESAREEAEAALLAHDPRRALFHWAPRARRKQVERYGLRPSMRSTTNTTAFPVICLGDSPSWAWALSGGMPWTPDGWWDLWQTHLDVIQDPVVMPSTDRSSGIHEVRTTSRIFKRHLHYVASRFKG